MATKKAIKEVQEKAEKHHKNRVDQLFTMFESHGEMLADHIGYINDINKNPSINILLTLFVYVSH